MTDMEALMLTASDRGVTLTVTPTGGGCMALEAVSSDGRRLLITDGDASLPFSAPEFPEYARSLYFGYYTPADEEDGFLSLGSEDFNLFTVGQVLTSWFIGHPYRDVL